jgi:hypothetical protein
MMERCGSVPLIVILTDDAIALAGCDDLSVY